MCYWQGAGSGQYDCRAYGTDSLACSKVIRAVEERNLLVRALGEKDKRQMYFSLTKEAHNCLKGIREQGIDIPELLQPLFASYAEGVSDSCE